MECKQTTGIKKTTYRINTNFEFHSNVRSILHIQKFVLSAIYCTVVQHFTTSTYYKIAVSS